MSSKIPKWFDPLIKTVNDKIAKKPLNRLVTDRLDRIRNRPLPERNCRRRSSVLASPRPLPSPSPWRLPFLARHVFHSKVKSLLEASSWCAVVSPSSGRRAFVVPPSSSCCQWKGFEVEFLRLVEMEALTFLSS
ncbi:hypothetical protein AHAS_Ahas20G0098000 [Arachis hypogaea]